MQKYLLTISPMLTLMFSMAGTANAASNAQMTITSNVVPATCDVSVSHPNLDLGNFTKASFSEINKPIAKSIKTFTLGLSNCEMPPGADSTVSVKVTGETKVPNNNVFNKTGTNTGIMLSMKDNEYIKSGDVLPIAQSGATPNPEEINGSTLNLKAGLASTSSEPDLGEVIAPVLFSLVYN